MPITHDAFTVSLAASLAAEESSLPPNAPPSCDDLLRACLALLSDAAADGFDADWRTKRDSLLAMAGQQYSAVAEEPGR